MARSPDLTTSPTAAVGGVRRPAPNGGSQRTRPRRSAAEFARCPCASCSYRPCPTSPPRRKLMEPGATEISCRDGSNDHVACVQFLSLLIDDAAGNRAARYPEQIGWMAPFPKGGRSIGCIARTNRAVRGREENTIKYTVFTSALSPRIMQQGLPPGAFTFAPIMHCAVVGVFPSFTPLLCQRATADAARSEVGSCDRILWAAVSPPAVPLGRAGWG